MRGDASWGAATRSIAFNPHAGLRWRESIGIQCGASSASPNRHVRRGRQPGDGALQKFPGPQPQRVTHARREHHAIAGRPGLLRTDSTRLLSRPRHGRLRYARSASTQHGDVPRRCGLGGCASPSPPPLRQAMSRRRLGNLDVVVPVLVDVLGPVTHRTGPDLRIEYQP